MKMSFLFLFVTGINSLDFLAYTASEQHSAEERPVPRIRHSSDSRDWKYPSVLEKAPNQYRLSDTLSALANPQPVENSYFGLYGFNKTVLVLLAYLSSWGLLYNRLLY